MHSRKAAASATLSESPLVQLLGLRRSILPSSRRFFAFLPIHILFLSCCRYPELHFLVRRNDSALFRRAANWRSTICRARRMALDPLPNRDHPSLRMDLGHLPVGISRLRNSLGHVRTDRSIRLRGLDHLRGSLGLFAPYEPCSRHPSANLSSLACISKDIRR